MGFGHSKHKKSPKDRYRALADQAASRINAQYPEGADADQIAAGVPNGKEPLVVMFRKNGEGKYAYDQEYYNTPFEHPPRRASGEVPRQREGRRAKTGSAKGDNGGGNTLDQGDGKVSTGLRGSQGSERVYVPVVDEADEVSRGHGEIYDSTRIHSGWHESSCTSNELYLARHVSIKPQFPDPRTTLLCDLFTISAHPRPHATDGVTPVPQPPFNHPRYLAFLPSIDSDLHQRSDSTRQRNLYENIVYPGTIQGDNLIRDTRRWNKIPIFYLPFIRRHGRTSIARPTTGP
ncbi:hypothetical protein EKO04_006975 [Ascochyta lentis]|uniref:Uncharacterized protein n=1 Tax=Ascochyta lentis TaxID=205686 RepID=A0A8H7MJ27_9PLEO|nr:hypothetical protein EKO04_006975 [Ascochyta lentis]